MLNDERPAGLDALLERAPEPVAAPHGVAPSLAPQMRSDDLRTLLAQAEEREQREAEAAERRNAEARRKAEELRGIGDAAVVEYDEIVGTVRALFPGVEALARRLEAAERAALARAHEADGLAGQGALLDRLRKHPAEKLRRFLDLMRDDVKDENA